MPADDLMLLTRRERSRARWIAFALLVVVSWAGWQFMQSATPRRVVLASGPPGSVAHDFAQRYKEILGREGVAVEERTTAGSAENARLLHDPASGVDVAFVASGVISAAQAANLVMLASLHYEPLWVFYRGGTVLTRLDQLRHKRLATGEPGGATQALVEPLLAANGISRLDTEWVPLADRAALRALQAGEVDAVLFTGMTAEPAVWQALHDPSVKLMSLDRAEAYPRRFPYLTRLVLPAGTVDLALGIPAEDVKMIATEAMLVARVDLASPLVHLLFDAAHELHASQGYFEAQREFPHTDPLDIEVSEDALRHNRFGPNWLNRYLPYWAATLVERLIVVLLPVVFIIVPLVRLLPQLVRWRVRSRIYRWYGELTLLERDIVSRTGDLPVERWLADLARIQRAAETLRMPASFASETYTLREHIALVRQTLLAKAHAQVAPVATGEPESG